MKKFLFVGLGNQGPEFNGTRHNLGMVALRAWADANPETPAHCLFPTTGMNNSGQAVATFLDKNNVPVTNVVIIHDDVELPLGQVRLTRGGSAKGHNGVRSIQTALGSQDFNRLRLGVGRPPEGMALNEFVLEKFRPDEQVIVTSMIEQAKIGLTNFGR